MSRVKLHDAEIGQVNARAPSGVSDRIQTIELKARGVEGFGVSGAWDPHGLLALAAAA
jgi:hypothetical protein